MYACSPANSRGTTMWLPFTSRTRPRRCALGQRIAAPARTHGPAALTIARARISSGSRPSCRMQRACQRPSRGCRRDERVRVWIAAPRCAASIALSTTRRLSSTQPSEYDEAACRMPGRSAPCRRDADAVDAARGRQRASRRRGGRRGTARRGSCQRGRMPRHVRQDEPQRPHDVRRDAQQHLALHQRLAHQPELEVLEVAQAAVDQLGAADEVAAARSSFSTQQRPSGRGPRHRARCRRR